MKRYPKSFLQLVTFGHFIVAVPLLLIAVYAYVTLENLADHYQNTVEEVVQAGQFSSRLAEDVTHLELALRRYEVLRDEEAMRDYQLAREEWRSDLQRLLRLSMLSPVLRESLLTQEKSEAEHNAAFEQSRDYIQLGDAISALHVQSTAVRDEISKTIEADIAETRQIADRISRHLVIGVSAAGIFAFGTLWFMRHLLARLIGRFERAVLALGRGELQKPISLDGPGDLRWLGRWLEWLRKRLLTLEQARAQVLRHVSHELKTPLAAMQEGTALLAEGVSGQLSREQQQLIGIVQSNVRRLQDLIDGLLRLQQAGHAAERIGYETLQLEEIVQQVIDTQRLIALERKISLLADLVPITVIAGREALLTIVHNLVSNAVKYSPPEGEVSIRLWLEGQTVFFSVADKGPGIPDSELQSLFEPFFRGSNTRQVAGVGLGLAIAREFVLALRGNIDVINLPEGGACFTVSFPVNAPYLRKLEHE